MSLSYKIFFVFAYARFVSECSVVFTLCFQCTVQNVHPDCVSVSVVRGVYGIIPNLHLAEVMLRHPEKKFVTGKKIKCHVSSS